MFQANNEHLAQIFHTYQRKFVHINIKTTNKVSAIIQKQIAFCMSCRLTMLI